MNPIVEIVLPIALGFIMFSLGLSLTPADFARVFQQRRAFWVGALGQMLMLPLLALGIARLFAPPPEVALGLLVLAVCPGGVTSAFMTSLFRGNTALSISMTAVFSVMSVATVPLVLGGLANLVGDGLTGLRLPVGETMRTLLGVTLIPVALGMSVRAVGPRMAGRIERPTRITATLLFAALVVGAILSQKQDVLPFLRAAGVFTAGLNVATLLAALGLGALAGLHSRDRVALFFECGMQNAPLAMFVAIALLERPDLSIAPATYGILQAPLTLLVAALASRLVAGLRPPKAVLGAAVPIGSGS
ncbi:MAG: bile acid:sodium symporter family protein [Myxococcota bacterium]|nr:bile acid:sodium symporter family protein [Myxococcota bacterium]